MLSCCACASALPAHPASLACLPPLRAWPGRRAAREALQLELQAAHAELQHARAAQAALEQRLATQQLPVQTQAGAASEQDVVVLRGQLEAARAEAESAAAQWAAERAGLLSAAQGLWAELQQCATALSSAVGQVRDTHGSTPRLAASSRAHTLMLLLLCCWPWLTAVAVL